MQDDDEDKLMAAAGNGDERAFNRIVQRHGPSIHNFVARTLQSDADAEEIASETLWRAWKQAPKWRPGGAKLSTWLFTVANNLVVDKQRRRRNVPTENVPMGGDDWLDGLADSRPGPEQALTAQSHLKAVMRFVDDLSENQRKVLLLSVQEEMSSTEIASVLGQSVGAVEQLLVRARRQLRDKNRRLL